MRLVDRLWASPRTFGASRDASTSSAQGPALSRPPGHTGLSSGVSYFYRRMLVETCDLEAPHDRRAWIDENQRSIPTSSGYAEQGVQACAIHEDELREFELQLVACRERMDRFREESSRGEVEVSREADAPSVGKRRDVEFRDHGTLHSRRRQDLSVPERRSALR